ncbi:gliding motility-associated C-terminal domain-containing protein [Pontibacter aydingkolensis]
MKQLYCLLIICVFALLPLLSIAQNEANTWYFGNGYGLKFRKGAAEVINAGPANTSTTYTYSNKAGQVILSVNLYGMYNKDGKLIENGGWAARNLGFDMYIIPKPGSNSLFYVFYTLEVISGVNWTDKQAIGYAIVDLAANNGAGKVLEKDKVIYQDTHGYFTVSGNCGNNTYWLVGEANTNIKLGTDQLFAFKIKDQGISKEPVRSEPVLIGNAKFLKFSPAGNKLVFAYRGYEDIEGLGLANFNTLTGEVSKSIRVEGADWYAVFSASGKKLYLNSNNSAIKKIWQFDISSDNEQDILASKKLVYDGPVSLDLGQPAPNGKIYYSQVENQMALGVINYPEREGLACEVSPNAISFPNKFVRSLPAFSANFLYSITENLDAGADKQLYKGEEVVLGGAYDKNTVYRWEPATYLSDPTSPNPTFRYTETVNKKLELTYKLYVSEGVCAQSDEVNITILPLHEGASLTRDQIPNIFTPNGDGINDTFSVPMLELYPDNELVILNRFGKEVYRKESYQGNWNGENVVSGVYFYQLYIKKLDEHYKGWVEIVR